MVTLKSGGAAVGGVAKAMKRSEKSFRNIALSVAAFAVTVIPGGILISGAIESHKNAAIAKDKKTGIADYMREQIAAQLKMNPKDVTYRDLELAAQINPAFAQMLKKVETEKARADRSTMIGTGIGTAVSMGGIVPGTGLISKVAGDTAGKLIADGAAFTAGSIASNVFNKDTLTTLDVMEVIDAKLEQGAQITGADVMLLRIAQDENLQKSIQEQFHKPLHKMSEVEQRSVLAAMPQLEAAERDAQAVNLKRITPQDLVMTSPAQTQQAFGKFTQQHQPRAKQGSWTQGVAASRANPQAGVVRS